MHAMAKKSKSNRMCCVPQCTNRAVKDEISRHSFPLDVRIKKEWVVKLRIGKPAMPPMNVCSAHFVTGDFLSSIDGRCIVMNAELRKMLGYHACIECSFNDPKLWTPNRRRLKKTAVPSRSLPIRAHEKEDLARIQEAAARDARASARHEHGSASQGTCSEPAQPVHVSPCEENPDEALCDVQEQGHETASHPCARGAAATAV
ncbi:uncharacterized protein LOC119167819 isoform X1 [Rhipicephalus microplus]|uniref:uncharacterized protein LOC119167819 isoform X1 n=1 Tax=Rhipicephalus microplus TaxID=6941 RepID=UPI003F6C0449